MISKVAVASTGPSLSHSGCEDLSATFAREAGRVKLPHRRPAAAGAAPAGSPALVDCGTTLERRTAVSFCEDRVCIVTGGGRGIGREYALMLAEHGAKVVVNDVGASLAGEGTDASPAQQVVDEIVAAGGEAIVNGDDVRPKFTSGSARLGSLESLRSTRRPLRTASHQLGLHLLQDRGRLDPLGHGHGQARSDRGGAPAALRGDDARAGSSPPGTSAALLQAPATSPWRCARLHPSFALHPGLDSRSFRAMHARSTSSRRR